MSQKYKKQVSGKNRSRNGFNYTLLPLLLIGFIPLVVFYYAFKTPLGNYPWYDKDMAVDLFLYGKSTAFICVNAVMACILACRLYTELHNKSARPLILGKMLPLFVPLALYGLLALVSTLFSDYRSIGFHGIQDQFESVWVLLSYCLTAYYAFLFIRNEEDIKTVFRWLFIGAGIVAAIGLFQACSLDLYKSPFAQSLYLPSSYTSSGTPMTFNFEAGRVYASLYNPNYVGTFVGLLAPVLLIFILFGRQRKQTLSYAALAIVLLICLFGSQSRGGILSVAASLLFMLFLFRSHIFRHWKLILAGIFIIAAAFFSINLISGNVLLSRLTGILNAPAVPVPLTEILLSDENVTIVYNNEPLSIRLDIQGGGEEAEDFQFTFTDKSGAVLPFHTGEEPGSHIIDDPRFSSFMTKPAMFEDPAGNVIGFYVRIDGNDWCFSNQTGDGSYYYYTNAMKPDKISYPESTGFLEGKERFFSGRGFIWSRTLPLLKDYLILGSGADTFTLVYPNDEYVGKFNFGYNKTLITRPHNMYLQIGVQTGLLSLLAFLAFYGMYFISSLRLYFKNRFDTYLSQAGAAIFAGSFGYMVTGLVNDSTITVAPVFWLLMGIGISINYQLQKAKKEAASS